MRKYILLLMILCLHLGARGQTGYEYDYWFDNDRSTMQSGSSELGAWQVQADVSGLSESIHAIHLQVRDQEGILSSPVTRYFVKLAQTTVAGGRYWFDDNSDQMHVSPQMQGVFDIDVSQLAEGFHTLRYQAVGIQGNYSSVVSRHFYKINMPDMNKWHCWFDNDDRTMQSGSSFGEPVMLDVSELTDGYHVIHIQVESKGMASTPIVRPFIKVPQVLGVDYLTCLCVVDDQLYKQERVSAQGGIVDWQFDVADLSQGFHRMFIQVVTPSGVATSACQAFFFRETTREEFGELKCVYAIDGSEFYNEAGLLANGTFHFDLDVSSLDDGLHRIAYMLSNGKGVTTKTQSQFFMKTPLGGNGIKEYWYWLNDLGDQQAKKVTLPERQNPFSLITLLPVESQPIRSSLFQFRIEQGQPVIYAKNDFHIRFYDAAGRFTDATKQYVDESVRQEVTDITLLESGVRATTAKPTENAIKWYKLETERGDSLQFKLDRAATIQLFAPSGEEVFNAIGSESTKWGGCHVKENGTYYLALHDVTATQGTTVSIDYNHIDKYAVLRQDVAKVGNGGCSTITFEGNGFRDLYAVDLYNAQGDTIKHVYIGHESDATTSVVFDFSDAATGKYHALFRFAEEDKVFTNLVTVEEARDIELATTVTYPSTFLRGTSTTYTIKITNKGNMTAYKVPVVIKVSSRETNSIRHLSLKGLQLKSLFDVISETDSQVEINTIEMEKLSNEIGEDFYFFKERAYDNEGRDSITIRSNMFFVDVLPNATHTITLSLLSSEKVEAWFDVPVEWDPAYNIERSDSRKLKAQDNWYCCHHEQIECSAAMLSLTLDGVAWGLSLATGGSSFVLEIGSCVSSTIGTVSSFVSQFACERQKFLSLSTLGNTVSTIGTMASCGVFKKIEYATEIVSSLVNSYAIPASLNTCGNAGKKKPNCPDNPPKGGSSSPVISYDPNDIYGYTAESGSKAIKDGQTDVYYRIEFENDTTFATAAAHEIVVTDTLSKELFDLSSFAPTRVKIGEKSAELTGDKNFVTTIDMRPEINAIAQVEGTFDEQKGIAKWHITSLDPMTMEPTDDVMQGVLPVNYDGSGIGEVSFDIGLKPDLAHGTEVKNRAAIVFDTNDVIMTPTWTNIIDRIAPESHIVDVQQLNDSTASVRIEASDELSGPWRYDVYVQYGEGSAWWKMAENVPVDTTASVKIYEGIDHGFYVVVTDSAGNVERKEAAREFTLDMLASQRGDVNKDGAVDIADVVAVYNIMAGNNQSGFNCDVNKDGAVDIADVVAVYNIMAGRQVANARANVRANVYRHSK